MNTFIVLTANQPLPSLKVVRTAVVTVDHKQLLLSWGSMEEAARLGMWPVASQCHWSNVAYLREAHNVQTTEAHREFLMSVTVAGLN